MGIYLWVVKDIEFIVGIGCKVYECVINIKD